MTKSQFLNKYFQETIRLSPFSKKTYRVYIFQYTTNLMISYIEIHNALVLSERNGKNPFIPLWDIVRFSLSVREAYKMILRKKRVDERAKL
jgi:hypothetical protein